MSEVKLLPVPQAFFDEFGASADDRVQDYAHACIAATAEASFKWGDFMVRGDKASVDAVISLVSIDASRKAMPPQRFEADPEPDFSKALERAQESVTNGLAIGGSGYLRAMDEACVYFVNHFGHRVLDRATPPAGAGEAVRVDAVALDRALQAFFAEQRYTMTPAEKDTLRIGLVDALSDLPPKGRFCDEGHTLEWCARDLMEAVNAYHRTTSGNDSRWMDSAARRVAVALAAPTPLPEAVRELVCCWDRRAYDDAYDTTCGNAHYFAHGGPADNDYQFCPYCAGKLSPPPTGDA